MTPTPEETSPPAIGDDQLHVVTEGYYQVCLASIVIYKRILIFAAEW